jgi:hypothetical protein
MGWRVTAAGAATVFICAQASAQTPDSLLSRLNPCHDALLDARSKRLNERQAVMPFVGFSSDPYSFGDKGVCVVVTFYRVFTYARMTREQIIAGTPRPDTETIPRFIARVVSSKTRAPGDWTEQWAEQTSCPAMEPALNALSGVVALRFTGNGPGGVLSTLPLDGGNHYALWARDTFYPTDLTFDRYSLEVSTNIGTPVARWIDKTLTDLAPCWTATRPVESPA